MELLALRMIPGVPASTPIDGDVSRRLTKLLTTTTTSMPQENEECSYVASESGASDERYPFLPCTEVL
jgi:hypothetical protein